MIVAVTTVLNEAPILGETVTHLLDRNVDWVVISDGGSTDGTRDLIGTFPRTTLLDQDGPLYQDQEMTRLAHHAYQLGTDWVIPFDADEYWCDLHLLDAAPPDVGVVYATVWQHSTRTLRHTTPKRLPKVAFRPNADMWIHWGNHYVDNIPGRAATGLNIRELQYRDYDHYLAKIDRAARLYATADFPAQYGVHLRRLVAMSDTERKQEWAAMQAVPTVYDPIP